MEYKYKGNFLKAIEELKLDNNNAVTEIYNTLNENKGILSNVIFTLKSNYAKKNNISDASSNILENFIAGYNATILDKLLNNGATLVASTNLDEFGLGGTGTFSNKGIISHPKNNKYYVGGSSSGSAATFTENIGFAIGSDTGDSVRLPASNIGKIGFKPSYGAVSRYGLFSYASSMDTVAWFNHSVNDCIIIAQLLFGKDKYDLTSLNINVNDVTIKKPKKVAYLNCFNLLEEYNEEKDFVSFMNKLTDSWSDYSSYKYDSSYSDIWYPLKGVRINNDSQNSNGIQIYQEYEGELKQNHKDLYQVYYKTNQSLIIEQELNRTMVKSEDINITNGEYSSNKYTMRSDISKSGQFNNISFYSKDGSNADSELSKDVIAMQTYWYDDDRLIYSVQGQGIYAYNATTRQTQTIVTGTDDFNITNFDYNSKILTYDNKNINITL